MFYFTCNHGLTETGSIMFFVAFYFSQQTFSARRLETDFLKTLPHDIYTCIGNRRAFDPVTRPDPTRSVAQMTLNPETSLRRDVTRTIIT